LVIHVLRELDALADGEFVEGFPKMLPGNGIKNGVIPRGIAAGGFLGTLDEVMAHDGSVCSRSNVCREGLGDLARVAEEGGFGARDPGGEEASSAGRHFMDGVGVVVSMYVDLGKGSEFVIWLGAVLVTLDMEDIQRDGEAVNEGPDGLDDVIVRVEEVIGGGTVGNWAGDVIKDTFAVNGDGEGRGGATARIGIRVLV